MLDRVCEHALRGIVYPEVTDETEERLRGTWPKVWRKVPDSLLGVYLVNRLRRRLQLGINDEVSVAQRIRRVRRATRWQR